MPNERKIETINCRYVNPVKSGGKFASIKTPGNVVYFAEPHVIEGIQKNQNVTVDVEQQKWGKGADEKLVNVIVRVLDAVPRTGGTQAPEAGPKPLEPMYRTKSAEEGLEMFVRGVMCSVFHGLGTVPDARTMASMVYHLRQAWTAGFAADLRPLPPKADSPPTKAVAAEGPTSQGFKQLGEAIRNAVPETLRESMRAGIDDLGAPF